MLGHSKLLAWWRFDYNTYVYGPAFDSSGNGKHLDAYNKPSSADGKFGRCFDNGTTDYAGADIPCYGRYGDTDLNLVNIPQGSICGWFKSNINPDDKCEGISIRNTGGNNIRIYIGRSGTSGLLYTGLGSDTGNDITGCNFTVGVWNHVAITWTHNGLGGIGTANTYWNGEYIQGNGFTVTNESNPSGLRCVIGGPYSRADSRSWRGSIDEVLIWKMQLNAANVKRAMYMFHPIQ